MPAEQLRAMLENSSARTEVITTNNLPSLHETMDPWLTE